MSRYAGPDLAVSPAGRGDPRYRDWRHGRVRSDPLLMRTCAGRAGALEPALSKLAGFFHQRIDRTDGAPVALLDADGLGVPFLLGKSELVQHSWCDRRNGPALVRAGHSTGPVSEVQVLDQRRGQDARDRARNGL